MSEQLPALKGRAAKIKFRPCPEGQSAGPKTIIGDIECDQCEAGCMCIVKIDQGGAAYAFHNTHHPKWAGDTDIERPCGIKTLSLNNPQTKLLIRHWTAQRYSKEEKTDARPSTETRTGKTSQGNNVPQPRSRTAAAGGATGKPAAAGGGGRTEPGPVAPGAPKRTGGWWGED